MSWPSVLTAFTNPAPTDRLNNPSHSSVEGAQNTALTELQTFVGTQSSAVGTFYYDIRSSNSDGGGHVQGVNKGGTGLTSYTKGDLLVASSSSVLTKQSIGTDNYVLTADSTKANGVGWAPISPTVGFDTTPTTLLNDGTETTVYSSVLAAGFFNANAGLKISANHSVKWTTNSGPVVTVNVKYNSSVVATLALSTAGGGGDNNVRTYAGNWQSVVLNNNNLAIQRSVTNVMSSIQENTDFSVAAVPQTNIRNSVMGALLNTAGQVNLQITYQSGGSAANVGWVHNSLLVEKISKVAP